MFKQPFKNKQMPLNGLQEIKQQLILQKKLLQAIQESLTANLSEHCLHATYHNKKAIIFTDSSVWASKLLFMRQRILKAFSQHVGEQVHGLRVKVLNPSNTRQQIPPKLPSSNVINHLVEANHLEPADKLSVSMNKLIKTLQKNKLLS